MALTIIIEHEKRGYRPLGVTFRLIYEGVKVAYSIDRNVELTPNMALTIIIEHEKRGYRPLGVIFRSKYDVWKSPILSIETLN